MKELLLILSLLSSNVMACDITTKVIKVHDGDTFTINMKDEITDRYNKVRINGIDSPEYGKKSSCQEEKELAIKAQIRLSCLILNQTFTLKNTGIDKYGRILADVYKDGVNIKDILLKENLAVPYDGGKKQSWCH